LYKHIELENFGVHRRCVLDPSPRLTGIVGPNGSGKSTVLHALEFLVTGAVASAGIKEQNINQFATKKGSSSVEGVLTHNGQTLNIVRGLQKAKSQLTIDGGAAVFGDVKVNAELAAVFGGALPLFGDYVFVKQHNLYDFIDATETVRAKAFAQLFGTKRAETCWGLIGARLAKITVPRRSEALDGLITDAVTNNDRLAALRGQVTAYDDVAHPTGALELGEALLARWDKLQRVRAEIATAAAERDALVVQVSNAECATDDAAQKLDDLISAHKRLAGDVDGARLVLAQWQAYQKRRRASDELTRRKAALDEEVAAHPKPPPPDGYVSSRDPARQGQIGRLSLEIAAARNLVVTFHDGVAACPTCGTPTTVLEAAIAAARQCVARGTAALNLLKDALDAAATYEVWLATWKAWRAGYTARVEAYNAAVEDLEDDGAAPDGDEDDLKRILTTHETLTEAIAAARREHSKAAGLRDQLLGRRSEREARLAQLTCERRALKCDQDAVAAARTAREAVLARSAERGRLLGEIGELEITVARNEATIATLRAEEASGAVVRQRITHLEALRAVLHRNNLPKQVAAGYLHLLESGVNQLLDRVGADFRIQTSDDQSYTAVFHDGRIIPANRLSVGQKVLLAINFRVEVNATFAHDIGVLCLDEPTQFLDTKNLGALDVALARLRTLSDARGLQCFVVTHEKRLSRLFDSVVAL
jgi:DNA repair exonuclease SbcCD ATPase subunit